MTDETETFTAADDEDAEVQVRVRPGKKPKKADRGAPLENSEPVPLFPDLDKDARNVITSIEVHRTTPPGEGYKGTVPPNATKEFLGRRFGNGMYNLEACNADGVCLRRVQNVTIALPPLPESNGAHRATTGMFDMDMATKLLERLTTEHEKSSQRQKDLTTETISATRETAKTYAEMMREDAKERAERDRVYHDAQQKQQQQFFTVMTTTMLQQHQQAMENMREGFQQTVQMMEMSHRHTLQQNNPAFLFQLFERGMRIGSEMGGDDNPVSQVFGMGLQGLDKVTEMMRLQKGTTTPRLDKGTSATSGGKKPNPAGKAVNRNDVKRLARLKRLAVKKGQDFEGMLAQAERMLGELPDDESDVESGRPESEDETGAGDVGGS